MEFASASTAIKEENIFDFLRVQSFSIVLLFYLDKYYITDTLYIQYLEKIERQSSSITCMRHTC